MKRVTVPGSGETFFLSRLDSAELLGTCSSHTILLDDAVWPTVEHYSQAMQFPLEEDREHVRSATSPGEARARGKLGLLDRLRGRQRKDWVKLRTVYMTRAVYTKCRTYSEIANLLLGTGEHKLVESDMYDYFWGSGRDLRGENAYGQVLMQVRLKLREEAH